MAQVIENTLQEVSGEREKLKNVFDRLDAGVAAFEEDGELIHINPSALSMLALPEHHKPSFDELTCALGIPEVTMEGMKKHGSVHIEEQPLSDVKTRELVVTIDIGVFGYDGTAKSGFIVVFQNITESALLEKNRREFIANVSHELIDDCSVTQHNARYHNKRDRGVFFEWISNNLNEANQKEQLEFYQKVTGRISNHNKYRSLDWDKPSPTIVSHLYKDGLMFIHPDLEQLRSITIREAALLQSFPADFEFLGSNAYCYKMIGNAVPVDFAKGIADAVCDVLRELK
jgi:hypothetical protein